MIVRTSLFLAFAVVLSSLWAVEKPIPCSLTVTPLCGDSRVTKSGGGNSLRRLSSNSSNTGSKTIERTLKWKAELRFREKKPEKTELKAYYIGYGNGGKTLEVLGTETKVVELDENGRAMIELTSPKTRLTKTRSRTSSGSSSGFSSTKSRTTGERVAGCVLQLFGDGKILKGWSSDPRWSAVAEKVPFSMAELVQKSGRIGQ